jgi:hypothetical protein
MDGNTAVPLVSETSIFDDEIDITKLKNYKLPGTDQILAEISQVRGE